MPEQRTGRCSSSWPALRNEGLGHLDRSTRGAWSATRSGKAATASGVAGNALTPRAEHHDRKISKSLLYALRVAAAFSRRARSAADMGRKIGAAVAN